MSHSQARPRAFAAAAVLAVFAIAAIAGFLIPSPADAVPAYGTHFKYYSSPSHATQVGYRYYDCNGVLQSGWGSTSPYWTSATYGCEQIEPV